jgi:hypothetical protein
VGTNTFKYEDTAFWLCWLEAVGLTLEDTIMLLLIFKECTYQYYGEFMCEYKKTVPMKYAVLKANNMINVRTLAKLRCETVLNHMGQVGRLISNMRSNGVELSEEAKYFNRLNEDGNNAGHSFKSREAESLEQGKFDCDLVLRQINPDEKEVQAMNEYYSYIFKFNKGGKSLKSIAIGKGVDWHGELGRDNELGRTEIRDHQIKTNDEDGN